MLATGSSLPVVGVGSSGDCLPVQHSESSDPHSAPLFPAMDTPPEPNRYWAASCLEQAMHFRQSNVSALNSHTLSVAFLGQLSLRSSCLSTTKDSPGILNNWNDFIFSCKDPSPLWQPLWMHHCMQQKCTFIYIAVSPEQATYFERFGLAKRIDSHKCTTRVLVTMRFSGLF